MSHNYFEEISDMIKSDSFKKKYSEFIISKTPVNYYNLVSYVTNKTRNIQSIYTKSNKCKYLITSYLFVLRDDEKKIIFNTLYYDTDFNTYDNYVKNLIVLDIQGYKPVKEYCGCGIVYRQEITSKKQYTCEYDKHQWKQVMYFGYSMTYNQMLQMIEDAKNNGVTHIIIPFIELNIKNDGTQDSLTIDPNLPIYNWINFTDEQKDNVNSILNSYDIKLLCSFGGAFSFNSTSDSKVGTQYVLNSPNYQDPFVLAEAIVDLLYDNKIYNVDFDIEHFPDCNNYNSNFSYLIYYFGQLHKYTKKIFANKYVINALITGAPQTPYFSPKSNYNSYAWCNLYIGIEKYFGAYIDFYNIQFYNQLYYSYSDYESIFEQDYLFGTSVVELSENIPLHKIVVGKLILQEVYYEPPGFMGYVPLYQENLKDTMANYVEKTKFSKNEILRKWFKSSGIMVWLYKFEDSVDNNQSLLKYYNFSDSIHY